jgi:hypothetical protein
MQRREFVLLAGGIAPLFGAGATPLFDGKSLAGWVPQDGKPQRWTVANGLLTNGPEGKINNIVSTGTFGDIELYAEFQIPKGSNSGIYLSGSYEVQIFDSFGKDTITSADGGSIYHRWIDGKPLGGSTAKVNASKAPGEWQSYLIQFRTPRFQGGKKTANAKFVKVVYNGKLVQENVECEGPTRSAMNIPEAATGPIMIQGDHGAVAFRKLEWRALKA